MKKYAVLLAMLMPFILSGCTKEVENKVITIDVNGQAVEGKFTGILEDNIATGEGTFKVSIDDTSSWVYKGEFADNSFSKLGFVEGYPLTVTYGGVKIRGIYSGNMDNGKISGEGSFVDSEEDITFEYTGDWLDGNLSGEGILKYDKYIVPFSDVNREGLFEGAVIDGIANGEGTFTAVNDDDITYVYTGSWEEGLCHGQGEMDYDSEDYYDQIGTFTKGDFTPTELEVIQSLGTYPKMEFEVNDMSVEFIKEHTEFFTTDDSMVLDKYVDVELGYKKLIKSPHLYGDKLVKVEGYRVLQIWEEECWGRTLTTMLIHDNNYEQYMFVFYLGSLPDVYEESMITIYALPINASTYETTIGGMNNCYILYGCYVN